MIVTVRDQCTNIALPSQMKYFYNWKIFLKYFSVQNNWKTLLFATRGFPTLLTWELPAPACDRWVLRDCWQGGRQLAVSVNYFLLKLTPVTNQSLTSAHEPAHREYLSPESEDSSWLGTGEGREDEWSGQLITDLTFYTWDPSLLVTKLIHLEQFP